MNKPHNICLAQHWAGPVHHNPSLMCVHILNSACYLWAALEVNIHLSCLCLLVVTMLFTR
jgi:hypothetical protein